MTPIEFCKQMERHFEIKSAALKFIDDLTATTQRSAIVDLVKFDEWLHKQHGNYEADYGLSMAELVKTRYSQSAHDFLLNIQ